GVWALCPPTDSCDINGCDSSKDAAINNNGARRLPPLRGENAVSRSCRSCSGSDLLWFLAAALSDGTTANLDAIPRSPFRVQMLPDLSDWSPATTCQKGLG